MIDNARDLVAISYDIIYILLIILNYGVFSKEKEYDLEEKEFILH